MLSIPYALRGKEVDGADPNYGHTCHNDQPDSSFEVYEQVAGLLQKLAELLQIVFDVLEAHRNNERLQITIGIWKMSGVIMDITASIAKLWFKLQQGSSKIFVIYLISLVDLEILVSLLECRSASDAPYPNFRGNSGQAETQITESNIIATTTAVASLQDAGAVTTSVALY
ncbi:hypothetical protein MRB53_041948 [Persea americana]|nr:hypothetical protein MRB53_041948 [Persea americana]